jgi:hypothetical protein
MQPEDNTSCQGPPEFFLRGRELLYSKVNLLGQHRDMKTRPAEGPSLSQLGFSLGQCLHLFFFLQCVLDSGNTFIIWFQVTSIATSCHLLFYSFIISIILAFPSPSSMFYFLAIESVYSCNSF